MMVIQESMENYLENILILSRYNDIVKSVDLADAMGFSKPSVSRAVHLMEDQGYLTIGDHGSLKLTESGHKLAAQVYEKHLFLTRYFVALGVDELKAEQEACRIEHVLSEDTFKRMKAHISHCIGSCNCEAKPLKYFTVSDLKKLNSEIDYIGEQK